MANLPTVYDTDEQDLDRLRWGFLIFSGFLGLVTAVSLFGLFGASFFYLPFGLVGALSTALYSYANYRAAKAIEQRVDPHATYFVAGMNMMAFPIGTVLGWYAWSVMTRPTVQELYAQGTPALPPAKPKAKPKLKSTPTPKAAETPPAPEMHWADAVAHVDEAEEKLWREIEAKAKTQSQPEQNGEGAANGGSTVKLVPGED